MTRLMNIHHGTKSGAVTRPSVCLSVDFFTLEGQPKTMSCPPTGISEEELGHIGKIAASVPVENFTIHGGDVLPSCVCERPLKAPSLCF